MRTVTHRQFTRFVIAITVVLAAVILLTCLLYTMVILQRNQDYVDGILARYQESLSTQMEEYTQLVQTAAYDASVLEYLQADDPYARHLAGLEVSTLFSSLKMVQNGIEDFFLFRPDDASVTYASLGARQPELMQRLWMSAKPAVIGIYPYAPSYGQAGNERYVTVVGCPVYNLSAGEQHPSVVGAVAVAISQQAIESNLSEFYQLEGIHYSLMDRHQTVILGEQLPVSEQDFRAAGERGRFSRDTLAASVTLISIPSMDAVLVVQTDKMVLLKDLFTITLVVLAMVLFLLGGMLYISGRISREITMPLSTLTEAVKEMDVDPTHTRHVPEEGNADFRMLSASLNRMLKTETRLTHELLEANRSLYESELAKKHLELQFLRSQINPHFLYNTLDLINWEAFEHDAPEISEIAQNLAKFYRLSLNKGRQILTIREELEHVRAYVSIENRHFDDAICLQIDVPEALQPLACLNIILQPFVENAILHGFAENPARGVCNIRIEAWREGDDVVFLVQDDGPGMTEAQIESIFRENTVRQSSGYGVKNIQSRIRLSFGENYGVTYRNTKEAGTAVYIRIPALTPEEAEKRLSNP